jgi:FAD synthase
MKVVRNPIDLPRSARAVAVGSFDGVHRGHRRVLDTAFESGLPVAVLTFDPHPRVLLGKPVELLTTLERKVELLVEYGVEEIVVLRFDEELAAMTPGEFTLRYLNPLGAQVVVAGPDFRFGHDRSGDLELLHDEGLLTRLVEPVAGVSSATPTSSTDASSRALRAAPGSASQPPTWSLPRTSSSRSTGSTPASPIGTGRPSRSASTFTSRERSGASRFI